MQLEMYEVGHCTESMMLAWIPREQARSRESTLLESASRIVDDLVDSKLTMKIAFSQAEKKDTQY